MTATEHLVKRLPNDIGGLPADPIERVEHELEPWEKRCHALADVLDYHKIISTEAKRRGVESLGAEMIGMLSYYERWIVAFSNILFQQQILTPSELARKMDEVAARGKRLPLTGYSPTLAVSFEQDSGLAPDGASDAHFDPLITSLQRLAG